MGPNMIPTYTTEIRRSIIDTYLSFNLVAILINRPSLGLTDTPTNTEMNERRNLTMAQVIASEIGSTSLKGYKRQIITVNPGATVAGTTLSQNSIVVTFQAAPGTSLDPFTHIVYVRGANLTLATDLNGNNRGNVSGTVVLVEPIQFAPVTLAHPSTFQHTLDLKVSTVGT